MSRYPHLTAILAGEEDPKPYAKKHREGEVPLYQFEKEIYNDIQITNKEADRYYKDFHRTGFAYSRIPMRTKLYIERFGQPDWCYTIWDGKASTLHAIYFQVGKDLIRIWDRGNILSEYPWKSFEKQAYKAGYKIKAFHQGQIEDNHGYWLD